MHSSLKPLSTLSCLLAGLLFCVAATGQQAGPFDTPPSDDLLALAITQHQSQDNKQAIKTLEQALELSWDDADIHYAMGVVQLARASEVSVLRIRRHLKEAIASFEQTIALNPEQASACFYLIRILLSAPELVGGDKDRALALNETLAPLDLAAHRVVASDLAKREDNFALAEQYLHEAADLQADSAMVEKSLADLYLQTGDYQQAINHGKKFLAIDRRWDEGSDIDGYYLLARAYTGLGQTEDALHNYQLTLDNNRNKRFAKTLRKEMKGLDAPGTESGAASQSQ